MQSETFVSEKLLTLKQIFCLFRIGRNGRKCAEMYEFGILRMLMKKFEIPKIPRIKGLLMCLFDENKKFQKIACYCTLKNF